MSALLAWALAVSAAAEPRMTLEMRAPRQGEIVLVVVEGHDAKSPPKAELRGREISFFPAASTGTWVGFAGIDLEASTGPASVKAVLRDPKGKVHAAAEALVIEAGKFPVQNITVQQKYVTPSKTDAERAEGESARLLQLFLHGEEKRLFETRFDSPIPGAATARFGERRVFNGQPRAPHSGMDLRAKTGTPVKAPAAGRVVLAGPLYYAGNTVVLDHGLGLSTLYAHLSKMAVKPGETVKKGQLLGRAGATGRVTGPHLHWSLRLREARVDPYSLVHLDLERWLKPRKQDPLKRSESCESPEAPAGKWGKASGGLRARVRPLKPSYEPGEPVSLLVEIRNSGKTAAFLDFVRDPAQRALVLGLNKAPEPPSGAAAKLVTEQLKLAPGKTLCFEQPAELARESTSYALSYGTEFLYSTGTARSGVWKGLLSAPPARVVVTPAQDPTRSTRTP